MHAHGVHRFDFLGESLDHMIVEAKALIAGQRLARDLEQSAGVGEGHQTSPILNRANRRTEITSPSLPEASLMSWRADFLSSRATGCSVSVPSATNFFSFPSTILLR